MGTTTAVELDEEMSDRIRQLADARRSTSPSIIREAVAQYVERGEPREAFRQAGRDASDEYERTGLHLTFEEAEAWLARLEAGESAKPPSCHR